MALTAGIHSGASMAIAISCGASIWTGTSQSDNCTVVTVMQSLSDGQHPMLFIVSSEVFPEQAHLARLTPLDPKVNSISVVSVIDMFAKRLIFGCKDTNFFLLQLSVFIFQST